MVAKKQKALTIQIENYKLKTRIFIYFTFHTTFHEVKAQDDEHNLKH